MSTATITTSSLSDGGLSYAQNVGRAARALLAAVLAVGSRPAAVAAPAQRAEQTTRERQVSLYQLYRLAGQYDSVMPNLAQELRSIAARS